MLGFERNNKSVCIAEQRGKIRCQRDAGARRLNRSGFAGASLAFDPGWLGVCSNEAVDHSSRHIASTEESD
jgi:hypothetical protein